MSKTFSSLNEAPNETTPLGIGDHTSVYSTPQEETPEKKTDCGINEQLVTGQIQRSYKPKGEAPVQESNSRNEISRNKPEWTNFVWCFVICLGLVIGVTVLLVCLNQFLYPTIASKKIIFNNNTIVLDLYSKGILPDAYQLYWYSAITIGISKPAYPVTIIYVDGEKACDPLPKDEKQKQFESSFILVDPASAPVNVIIDQYLTRGATLYLNFTLHFKNSQMELEGNKQITFCILDNRDSYQHYKDHRGISQDCLNREKYTFPVTNDANYTLEYTFQESKYFFIVLLSTTKVEIQHSYKLLYQFYDLNNYHPQSKQICIISEERDWKNCSLDSSGAQLGCFLVYAAPAVDTPQFTDMDVTLFHNLYTSAFIAIAIISVVVVVVLSLMCVMCAWMSAKKKYCCKQRKALSI